MRRHQAELPLFGVQRIYRVALGCVVATDSRDPVSHPPGLSPAANPHQTSAATFDAERADLLARLEACCGGGAGTPAEVYRLQAENRKRTEEVRELQKVRLRCAVCPASLPPHPTSNASPHAGPLRRPHLPV